MKLTSDQVDTIRALVVGSGIQLDSLKDDVLDHLCCVVEDDLNQGREFNESLANALEELAPHGLYQIEKETLFLLNSKKIIVMKKIMYFVGFIGAFALTLGVTFKWLDWAGGDELFLTGFLNLTLLFAPLAAVERYKVSISKAITERLRITIGLVSAMSIGLGAMLKISGLFGGDFLLLGGTVVFAMGFLPFHFFTLYKKSVA